MCKAKPAPRCLGHAREELDRYHADHPGLASLTDAQVRSAHAQAVATKAHAKARLLTRELDLRLDADATREGIRELRAQLHKNPGDNDLWFRYNAAQATFDAKVEHAEAASPTHGRETNARTLAERRERLARMEGRAAATMAAQGTLPEREVSALAAEYDRVLECEAAARLVAARRRPDPAYATPGEQGAWRGALDGVNDGLATGSAADAFAARSHRAAAVATWGYPHRLPAARYQGRRSFTGSPLDAVRVALLTRSPVRHENGQVRVESQSNEVRAKLWHAGYQMATPAGPIVLRGTGPGGFLAAA